jgi:hypothetical protein
MSRAKKITARKPADSRLLSSYVKLYKGKTMSFLIHQGNKRIITPTYTKADGTPGEIEGAPVWAIVPDNTSVLAVAPDGLSAELTWAGSGDGAILTITADGDLGTGVFPVVITETFDFVAPLGAVAGAVTVSDEVAA